PPAQRSSRPLPLLCAGTAEPTSSPRHQLSNESRARLIIGASGRVSSSAPRRSAASGVQGPTAAASSADQVAGGGLPVPVEVVLMLGLRLPERLLGVDFSHHGTGPQTRGFDFGNRRECRLLLLFVRVEDGRTVAWPKIAPLLLVGCRVVNVEEAFRMAR